MLLQTYITGTECSRSDDSFEDAEAFALRAIREQHGTVGVHIIRNGLNCVYCNPDSESRLYVYGTTQANFFGKFTDILLRENDWYVVSRGGMMLNKKIQGEENARAISDELNKQYNLARPSTFAGYQFCRISCYGFQVRH